MYLAGGEPYLVVDAQVHAWDASPHNQAVPAGEEYATDLLRRYCELDGAAVPPQHVERVSEDGLVRDLFEVGYVDQAVLQPVVLEDLFVLGFSPLAWHAQLAAWMPGRFVLSGELDPNLGQPGARGIGPLVRRLDLRGLTLCEYRRPSGQMRLREPWLRRSLARWGRAGADIVHIGVGPSSLPAPWRRGERAATVLSGRALDSPRWAGSARAGSAQPVLELERRRVAPPGVDVVQVRELAQALPEIHFVLGAGCAPIAQLCRLGRLPNVHVLLTEILPWIGSPNFAPVFGDLLTAFGAERLLFGSGYPMVRPGRLVRELAAYQFPTGLASRHPRFDADAVRAVLGGNAARLYRIPIAARTPAAMGRVSVAGY